jgi:hypothetical protein
VYSSPSTNRKINSRRMIWEGNAALMARKELHLGLGRQIRRWLDSVKVYSEEIRWNGMDWIYLAQNRDRWRILVNMVNKFRFCINLLVNFCESAQLEAPQEGLSS